MIRTLIIATAITVAGYSVPVVTANAQQTPSSSQIYKQLNKAAPRSKSFRRAAGNKPVTVERIKRDRRLRRHLPAIDIQSINFAFGSSNIPRRESWKVETIANALMRFRRGNERILLEGHTDAVGSDESNLYLSEDRARALKRALVNWYGVSRRMLITAGYGEDHLLVDTPYENWRNRRVTLRRLTGVLN